MDGDGVSFGSPWRLVGEGVGSFLVSKQLKVICRGECLILGEWVLWLSLGRGGTFVALRVGCPWPMLETVFAESPLVARTESVL